MYRYWAYIRFFKKNFCSGWLNYLWCFQLTVRLSIVFLKNNHNFENCAYFVVQQFCKDWIDRFWPWGASRSTNNKLFTSKFFNTAGNVFQFRLEIKEPLKLESATQLRSTCLIHGLAPATKNRIGYPWSFQNSPADTVLPRLSIFVKQHHLIIGDVGFTIT